jgi:hypothetical protein
MEAPSEQAAKLKAPCFGFLEKDRDEPSSSRSIPLTNRNAENR